MMSRRLSGLYLVPPTTLLLSLVPYALGQPAAATSVERFERAAEQLRRETFGLITSEVPPGQRALIDYGGYLTFSYLSFDDSNKANHAFRGYDLVGYGRVNFDNAHDIYVRGRLTYRDFNPGDSFEGEADHLEGHIEEAYYRFDLAAHNAAYHRSSTGDGNISFQLGRQFQTWGNGLVLSQFVDGGRVTARRGALSLQAIAAVTAHDLTVDFDASRPSFEDDTSRGFYGALAEVQLGAHRPFAYAMVQRDHNSNGPVEIGPLSTRYQYNSYYIGIGIDGSISDRLSYGAELVYEGGDTLSSSFNAQTLQPIDQQQDPIRAYAALVRLDYLSTDRQRSRIGVGLMLASGDSDRGDSGNTVDGNRPGTTDHGFNALGFVDDGLAFSPSLSNLLVVRGTVSTYPLTSVTSLAQLQVGVNLFAFAKLRRSGAIDEPSDNQRYLGWEPDLFLNWQVADDVTFVLRYGIFFPGDALPSDDHRQFFYAGLTYAF